MAIEAAKRFLDGELHRLAIERPKLGNIGQRLHFVVPHRAAQSLHDPDARLNPAPAFEIAACEPSEIAGSARRPLSSASCFARMARIVRLTCLLSCEIY